MYRIWFFEIGNDWGWSVDIPELPGSGDIGMASPMTEDELKQFIIALQDKFGEDAIRLEKDGAQIEI